MSSPQVERVRQASDIIRVVSEYVPLRKTGVNHTGLCPFHSEKTPSFAVHPTRQIFHCFGCGEGGDVFKFVMLIERVSFPEALRLLAEKGGIRLPEKSMGKEMNDPQAKQRSALYRIHEAAAQFFAEQMGATAEGRAARAYLTDRGLTGPIISRFGMGYALSSGPALAEYLQSGRFEPEALEASGLLVWESTAGGNRKYSDRFRRRIIFPITSERGRVIAFAGRALGNAQASVPKYLNSPETPIYAKSRVLYNLSRAGGPIRKGDAAILVEGYMDCIALASAGIENVVASCGTSLTFAQVQLLGRYTRRVVVNFDSDAAGIRAAERSLDLLLEEGLEVRILELPEGLDPDGYLRRHGPEAYRRQLDLAPSYLDYLTERAAQEHDLSNAEGKVAAVNALLPRLARIPNRIGRAETARRVAERLNVQERLLGEEIARAASERRPEVAFAARDVEDTATLAEKRMLQILFGNPALLKEFARRLREIPLHQGLVTGPIFEQLLRHSGAESKPEVADVAEHMAPEHQKLLYKILTMPMVSLGKEEAERCWTALRRHELESKRERLQKQIEAAQRSRDRELLYRLSADKSLLNKELAAMKKI